MTTDLLKLTREVTSDSEDTLLQGDIRRHANEIRLSLQKGEDFKFKRADKTIVIRANKSGRFER